MNWKANHESGESNEYGKCAPHLDMDENPYKPPQIEGAQRSFVASIAIFLGLRPTGRCSYCGEKKRPLAEGIDGVLICRDCAAGCVALIDEERAKKSSPS